MPNKYKHLIGKGVEYISPPKYADAPIEGCYVAYIDDDKGITILGLYKDRGIKVACVNKELETMPYYKESFDWLLKSIESGLVDGRESPAYKRLKDKAPTGRGEPACAFE